MELFAARSPSQHLNSEALKYEQDLFLNPGLSGRNHYNINENRYILYTRICGTIGNGVYNLGYGADS